MSLFWLIFTLLNFSFAHQTEYDTWNDNFIWTPDSGPLPWMTKTISLPERREQIQMQDPCFVTSHDQLIADPQFECDIDWMSPWWSIGYGIVIHDGSGPSQNNYLALTDGQIYFGGVRQDIAFKSETRYLLSFYSRAVGNGTDCGIYIETDGQGIIEKFYDIPTDWTMLSLIIYATDEDKALSIAADCSHSRGSIQIGDMKLSAT